ncbi:cyclin-dependent kinase G-2-like isoform X1 [Zingiber officinale]|uniref:Protein kinase domain-containing protein n=1 Tax=Zingiber officinale TaxID=94328 RepID=A0A8J5ERM9_ZINOF|nr:cyclin-dependent kinase G-2-like isoform X1 [Zingiber officinale]XP_042443479.1 cyclin-dependent kinase G-2-like isoform X1 [Zingiber officinale]XP_042443480.1 cyclin-dependent kinase G-2-like isoform X1 [Zingiber officinale]XP_042443481.1 cyclin-dependent kinase G-2-like isoform X1 [Zingiber officinale]XP_042443482.1 cyclin-dependent kinase G-2-like isoform X1 [Zingiber officinale]XP_042443483.1 cyclin-dependent kinase G-2-like isoform X1 [Zingiber officinale]XP_042443484.1 cyclin-depende
MAAGRHSRYRDHEFRDRDADVKPSGRKDYYRDRLRDGGLDKDRDHPYRDLRDKIGVAQRNLKSREVINDSYRPPLSSNFSGGSKSSQKINHLSGKDVDRETGELSSGSGSDDIEAPISKIRENEINIHENGNSSMDSRKRKFSPIIWDRNDGKRLTVANSSSKSSKIENHTLPPPPPRPLGFIPQHCIDSVRPSGSHASPSDADISVDSPPALLASNNQEAKSLDDFEDEPAPAWSISISRWADGNSAVNDGDESLNTVVVPKMKKSTPLSSGSSGQHLHMKVDSPEPGEVIISENSRVDFSKSYSREDEYDDIDAELYRNNHLNIDGVESSTSDQLSDTNSEEEDGRSKTPEPAQPPKRSINMLQGCRSVDEFEKLNKIDEGTYGVVYRAKDKKTGEIVALKKVKMAKEKEGFPLTSLREINILLSFHHPSIVDVKEVVVGNSVDKIFMVMEYMEHDLKALMETMKQPFSQSEVKCLMLQLFSGVKYLHDNWVLHRDLKTSNILLNNRGELKICDFGLSRQYGSPLKPYTPLVVTLWYRAPELLLGAKEYSTAIDMWSLGCIMAELLSKDPLFCGKSERDQLDKMFRTLGTPTESIWPGFAKLPGVKVNFVKQPYNKLREKFPPTSFIGGPTLSEAGFDLLNRLLTYNPDKRITAESALNHPWFQEVPLPKSKEFMPTFPAQHAQDRRQRRIMKSPDPLAEQRKELQQGDLGLSTLFG